MEEHESDSTECASSGSPEPQQRDLVVVPPPLSPEDMARFSWPPECFSQGHRSPPVSNYQRSWSVGCVVELDLWWNRPRGLSEAAPQATAWQVVGISPSSSRQGTQALLQWLLPPRSALNPSSLACHVNVFKLARPCRSKHWSQAVAASPGELGEPVSNEFGAPRSVVLSEARVELPAELWDPACFAAMFGADPQSPTPPPPPKGQQQSKCETASPKGGTPTSESGGRPREKAFPEEGALVSDLVDQWYKGIVPGASREELADVRALGDVLLRNPALAEHQAEVFDFFHSIKPALGALS
eukprot:m51a1_g7506 hypothetical protein (299) ;mRNA; r:284531-285922